jgi:hypothetical protein
VGVEATADGVAFRLSARAARVGGAVPAVDGAAGTRCIAEAPLDR